MLVVHGLWAYGAPLVWAEDSGLPPQAPPHRGRLSRAPRPHPFAARPDALADALAGTLAGPNVFKLVDHQAVTRLEPVNTLALSLIDMPSTYPSDNPTQ